jgi:hypothetical protein
MLGVTKGNMRALELRVARRSWRYVMSRWIARGIAVDMGSWCARHNAQGARGLRTTSVCSYHMVGVGESQLPTLV